MKNILVILGLGLGLSNAFGQTRVTDINTSGSSSPFTLTALGDHLYFGASTPATGNEPYQLDSAGNVILLGEIRTGAPSSFPRGFAEANGQIYFLASIANPAPGQNNVELFKYDHNTITQILVQGSNHAFKLPPSNRLTSYDDKIIVGHHDHLSNFGAEPYFYDGVGNFLKILVDINPNSTSSLPDDFIEWNGVLYFTAINHNFGFELFSYDGTTVTLETDIAPGPLNGLPNSTSFTPTPRFIVYNNNLYFAASTGTPNEMGLYKFDGIHAPVLVSNTSNYRSIHRFYEVNNTLILVATDSNFQNHMYTYDDIHKEQILSDTLINNGVVSNNKIMFIRTDSATGTELWECDGIHKPQLVADLNPGTASSFSLSTASKFDQNVSFENKFYFSANDGQSGNELWLYDGINPPTQVADIHPNGDSNPLDFTLFNNDLYFTADDGINGIEIWRLNQDPLAVNNRAPMLFNLHPNPATEFVQIDTQEEIQEIKIMDLTGKLVYSATSPDTKINVSHLANGAYIFHISLPSGLRSQKVIISDH